MVKTNPESSPGSKESGASKDAESKPENQKRMALSGSRSYPVERSFYDPRQNCVIDVLRVEKIVKDRAGNDVNIVVFREQYCKDEALQAKYKQAATLNREVTDV